MITSVSNQKIKNIRALLSQKKARDEEGLFAIEGRKPVIEAAESGLEVREVYLAESVESDMKLDIPGAVFETVSDKVFSQLSQTVTPQGVAAVVKKPEYDLKELLKGGAERFLVLEDIRDPGNLGTMIRTAEAAGIGCVIMTESTVDIFNPKVVRATMGSLLRVPFIYTEDLADTFAVLREKGVKIVGTGLRSSVDFKTVDMTGKTAIVIGNEANGMTEGTAALCDKIVRIPMAGRVESLNAAIAAAILMYA